MNDASYIVILFLFLIMLFAIIGGTYWYISTHCKYDRAIAQQCSRDCDCIKPNKCALANGASETTVCCPLGTIVVNGRTYCDNLVLNSPCLTNEMCANKNCVNGLCSNILSIGFTNLTNGSRCTSSSQCVSGNCNNGVCS